MTPEEIRQRWPTFCPAPYKYLDIRKSGVSSDLWRICCCNLQIDQDSQDPQFTSLKQKQLNGEWSSACSKCWQEESQGGISERIKMIMDLGAEQCERIERTGTADDYQIKATFSNLCQLACRSCVPGESSTFAKYSNSQHFARFQLRDITLDYFDEITQDIETAAKNYQRISIHINGGESMIQNGAEKVLDWMIQRGLNQQAGLILTTAGTVTPNLRWQNYFDRFLNLGCNLSIDSVGRNYHYVRWPAQWTKVDSNIQWFFDYAKQKPYTNYWITPVISLNNLFYIEDYLDYWLDKFQQHQTAYSITPISLVARTWHLDIDALPVIYRPPVQEFLTKIKTHTIFKQYPKQLAGLQTWIENTTKELSDRINEQLWPMFLKHTAYFDRSTGAEFADYNERFYNILTDQDRQQYDKILNSIDLKRPLYDYVTPPF